MPPATGGLGAPAPRVAIAVRVLAVLTAGLFAICAPAAATAKPSFGVVPQNGGLPEGSDLDLMPKAGIDSIRLMAHWPTLEPQRGTYDWTTLDATVRETIARDLDPFLYLYGTPTWAAHHDGRRCAGDNCSVYYPKSARSRADFAQFAAAAAARYGPDGDFWKAPAALGGTGGSGEDCPLPILCPPPPPPPPPPVDPPPPGQPPCGCTEQRPINVWQIWNEQNSPKYFAPKVNVRAYAAMLKPAAAAIQRGNPRAEIVLGGMWGPASAANVVEPVRPYLKRLYRIGGARKSFDSIAIHPYSIDAETSVDQLEVARQTLDGARDRKAGIWVTEFGWASGGPRKDPYVKGKRGQAQMLAEAMRTYARRSREFRLHGAFWYSWRDLPGGSEICAWCGHAGLRATDGSAKPAWRAFAKVAR